MMRQLWCLGLALLISCPAYAGELSLTSSMVHNGEVAQLRWQGEPLSFGVVRFLDDIYYLYPDAEGAVALLPVDLKTLPGNYPLLAAMVDKLGRTTAIELSLSVVDKPRPVERLSLPTEMVSPGAESLARIERESRRLQEIFSGHSSRSWKHFVRPVDDPISSIFGKRRIMNGVPKSPHSGTDFRSPMGTDVRSISSGRVVLVAELFYTGNTVIVDHGEGLYSLYAHLSRVKVMEGKKLASGEVLGEVGSTGRSTGPHLHLTVKLLGTRIDPISLLALLGE